MCCSLVAAVTASVNVNNFIIKKLTLKCCIKLEITHKNTKITQNGRYKFASIITQYTSLVPRPKFFAQNIRNDGFFAFRPIRHASVVANILREKFGPGDEAINTLSTVVYCVYEVRVLY